METFRLFRSFWLVKLLTPAAGKMSCALASVGRPLVQFALFDQRVSPAPVQVAGARRFSSNSRHGRKPDLRPPLMVRDACFPKPNRSARKRFMGMLLCCEREYSFWTGDRNLLSFTGTTVLAPVTLLF